MVQPGQITFYTHVYSPNCHRVQLALDETKAEYTPYTVNLMEKPEWFAAKVNSVGKIPAITYGGPKTAPDEPSSESARINESLIIVEFLADLFPEANLLPSDPLLRAKARLFANVVETKVLDALKAFFFVYADGAEKTLFEAFEALQARLPATGFAVGKWSTADIAAGPYLTRIYMLLKNDIGKYPAGKGAEVYIALQGPKFARLSKYIEDVKQYPSFKATWDEALQLSIWNSNPAIQRA
ncbi:thioredoxin-like protein [Trametes meyenii]|nr:thioredoxin-like protein [Trametes meyenii]